MKTIVAVKISHRHRRRGSGGSWRLDDREDDGGRDQTDTQSHVAPVGKALTHGCAQDLMTQDHTVSSGTLLSSMRPILTASEPAVSFTTADH